LSRTSPGLLANPSEMTSSDPVSASILSNHRIIDGLRMGRTERRPDSSLECYTDTSPSSQPAATASVPGSRPDWPVALWLSSSCDFLGRCNLLSVWSQMLRITSWTRSSCLVVKSNQYAIARRKSEGNRRWRPAAGNANANVVMSLIK